MRAAKLALVAAAFAAIAGSQTETYDVRHLRWGMRVEEVKLAEPNAYLWEESLYSRDTVVGIDSDIAFEFNSEGLFRVTFSEFKDGIDADEGDGFLFAWQSALEKKYGRSYLCSGDEKICHLTTVESLEKARKLYHSTNIKFTVEFTENEKTHVFIHMGFKKIKGKTEYDVNATFNAVPKDNF